MILIWTSLKLSSENAFNIDELTLSKTTNFRLVQFERNCRRNFKLDENGRKLSKQAENTVGKGEIAHYEIAPFPTVFSNDLNCRHIKTRAYLGKD